MNLKIFLKIIDIVPFYFYKPRYFQIYDFISDKNLIIISAKLCFKKFYIKKCYT